MIQAHIQNIPLFRDLRAWSVFLISSGIALSFFPQRFDRISGYRYILDIFSTNIWGLAFMLVGLIIFIGIHTKKLSYKWIRAALVGSATVFAMWGTGLVIAYLVGSSSTPYGLIVYFLLLYIPFSLMKRDPLINPMYKGV